MNVESKIIRAIEKSGLNINYRLGVVGDRIICIENLDARNPNLGPESNKIKTRLDVSGASTRPIKSITQSIINKWGY